MAHPSPNLPKLPNRMVSLVCEGETEEVTAGEYLLALLIGCPALVAFGYYVVPWLTVKVKEWRRKKNE